MGASVFSVPDLVKPQDTRRGGGGGHPFRPGLDQRGPPKRSRGRSLPHGPGTFSTSKVGGWRLAVGGWRLAVGGWRLAGGGWRRLAAGPWGLSLRGGFLRTPRLVSECCAASVHHPPAPLCPRRAARAAARVHCGLVPRIGRHTPSAVPARS